MESSKAIHFAFFFLHKRQIIASANSKVQTFTITFLPEKQSIRVQQGITLLDAAIQAGLSLYSPCGGIGSCRKCRVFLEPSGKEVLACQYCVYEDLTVRIPTESEGLQGHILEHGIRPEQSVRPRFVKYFLSCPPASLSQLLQSLTMVFSKPVSVHPDACLANEMARTFNGLTSVLLFENDQLYLLALEEADTTDRLYGIAADIGTTTLVLYGIDLNNGRVVQTVSCANPQIRFADDVIGRIHYAQNPSGLEQLHQCLIDTLNEQISDLCRKIGIVPQNIYEIAAVGNTTMNHLLLGYPVQSLGRAPYHAYSLKSCDKTAGQAGLHIHPAGRLYTVENVAGFVGSDTVAAALAAGMDTSESVCLLVDIGTNAELVLGNKHRLLAASCAAGPALEGARILHGSRAENGAIQRVSLVDGDLVVEGIGTEPLRSICGSGLIDAVAVMLETGILETSGSFGCISDLQSRLPAGLAERLVRFDNQPAFVLAWKDRPREPAVLLTQKDIREVQLAKAAISAGIHVLLEQFGVKSGEIQSLFLAGAFGNYIQKASAVRIGLLPPLAEHKIRFIGNAAGAGAQMVLVNQQCRQMACRLAEKIEYIELAGRPNFQDLYCNAMLFE